MTIDMHRDTFLMVSFHLLDQEQNVKKKNGCGKTHWKTIAISEVRLVAVKVVGND